MTSDTSEQALEACIEKALTGSCRELHKEDVAEATPPIYGPHAGYEAGLSADFDREFAIDRAKFWRFLEETQPTELAKLSDRPNWQRLVLERLNRKIPKDGILSVLKRGLAIDDAHLTLLYSLPYNDTNPDVRANFYKNIFSVTRQVHYSDTQPHLSVDMVVFINGLAIATFELKNAWSGQTVYHAQKQYREDRDPKEPLFQFARCLVHFAVDTDEVYMTTRLVEDKTYFLPFNKGHNFGKGNPPNPNGHKSAYLWEEVLTRESLANIIQHFAKIVEDKDKKTGKVTKTLIFPRYHQLDVVRKLLDHVGEHGVGQTYLIQHSAGSGKSHSITWTAYQLIELYERSRLGPSPQPSPSGRRSEGSDRPVFDSVVVVTDRQVLDRQLRSNIRQFSEVKNIIAPAYNSQDLKQALENGKKIIITTVQKFPFIVDGIEDLSDRNFAVIIDEAHSSQSGKAADTLNMSLGMEEEEPEDVQDTILKAMEGRKLSPNASYFAFTATPKNTTLEKFGRKISDGSFVPFHLYSMKQAIEEGFILDVLANYTTYKSYYEIQKSIQDNPLFDTTKAQKKLRAFVEGHKETIATKADIMLSHFLEAEADQLSPLIDIATARFDQDLELEDEAKIDFKVKAKQFVKIYGQVACIIPYNNVQWEMLYWFLKFLIPKLRVQDPDQEQLDALLESVDLSTYGLERVRINQKIDLDAAESTLNPQNPNPRGYHGEAEKDPLDEIIRAFNDRFFSGWDATPEEQRVKFSNIARHVINNPNYQTQVVENQDKQNSRIALEQMIKQAVNQERKRELDLYKRYASDPEFKRAFDASIARLLQGALSSQLLADVLGAQGDEMAESSMQGKVEI